MLQSALLSLSPYQAPTPRNDSVTASFAEDPLAERGTDVKRSSDPCDSEDDRDQSKHRSKRQKPKSDSRMNSTVGSTLLVSCVLLTVFQATDRRSRMREALTNLVHNENTDCKKPEN